MAEPIDPVIIITGAPSNIKTGGAVSLDIAITDATSATLTITGTNAAANPANLSLSATGGTYNGVLTLTDVNKVGDVIFTVEAVGDTTVEQTVTVKVLTNTLPFTARAQNMGLRGL